MSVIATRLGRYGLVALAVASIGVLQEARAVGTAASTTISDQATVNYSVGSVAQPAIASSPTGNSTPGGGAPTTFVVDNRIDLTVVERSGGNTLTSPGAANVVTSFTLTNTGNAPQGYQLTAANLVGTSLFSNTDNTDVTNLRAFVDAGGDNTFVLGTDTATAVNTLAPDTSITVFIVADVPVTATNNQFANVQLLARTAVPGTNGATLESQTTVADTPGAVDVVFGDAARDAQESAADQYAIQSAALSISKTSVVVSDPFNATNPKAIPGAVIEYAVVIANAGTLNATGIGVSDPLPAATTFVAGAFGAGQDVQISVGATNTSCVAEVGSDVNSDGCARIAGNLVVDGAALPAVVPGPAGAVTVRFRVSIN